MPLYEYTCDNGHIKKETRSIHTQEPQHTCDLCNQPMRQVVGGVGVAFKGKGFYSTDKTDR